MCQYFHYHIIFVLHKDAEFLEKGHHKDQELLTFPIQCLHQQMDYIFVPHLQLCTRVLRQV